MSTAQIIADLARAKVTFQLRAIKAAMGWHYSVDMGASPDGDRAGGPSDLSRCASQPEALIPSAGEEA